MGRGASELTAVNRVPRESRKIRLDILLVERGLAGSRERARALILAGDVRVDGQVATTAGTPVSAEADVSVAVPDHPYVGRGGLKLARPPPSDGIMA